MEDKQSMKHLKVLKAKPHNHAECRLCMILKRQAEVNAKFFKAQDLNLAVRIQWSMKIFVYISMELSEFMNWLPCKHWKKKQPKVNKLELKFEIIDMLHFLATFMLIWGMNCDEVYAMYSAKADENIRRQNGSY